MPADEVYRRLKALTSIPRGVGRPISNRKLEFAAGLPRNTINEVMDGSRRVTEYLQIRLGTALKRLENDQFEFDGGFLGMKGKLKGVKIVNPRPKIDRFFTIDLENGMKLRPMTENPLAFPARHYPKVDENT